MSSTFNIAIIGGGLIGPRHAASILANPLTALHSLTDPAPHAFQLASTFKTTHHASLSALLASTPLPDAAILCTPNATHVSLALQLIAAGIPILVEKPISTSIESGAQLVKAAKEKGVALLVGHHRRFNPYLLAAKRVLEGKKLGKVIAVQGTWCLKKPLSYFDGICEWRRNAGSGGVVLINLIHEVDLLQYLLGPIVFVSALETEKTRGFEAEEGAAILLRFKSGVVGSFVLSDAAPSPWNFESGTGENPTIPHVRKEEGAGAFYRIMGSEASLSVPDLKIWRNEWTEKLVVEDAEVNTDSVAFDFQVQNLFEVVREVKEPNCSGEEGLSAVVVCEAVKRSMESGKGVEIHGLELKRGVDQAFQ